MANGGESDAVQRRRIATLILCQMINTEGTKLSKVIASVDFADLLIEELNKPAGKRIDERAGVIPHGRRRTSK